MSHEKVVDRELFDHPEVFRDWNEISLGHDDNKTVRSRAIKSDGGPSDVMCLDSLATDLIGAKSVGPSTFCALYFDDSMAYMVFF
jgi:hypothetical protein